MADLLTLTPADLLIDEENPRISQPNGGQRAALQSLARHLKAKVAVLAEDIVDHGLDPADLSIVMPVLDGMGYTVLEGNRRLSAIRALENPELIADVIDGKVLKQLRALSKRYQENPIESMPCVAVRTREEARHWIELRHTGENEGAGRVRWGSEESSRYKARAGRTAPHLQALDFLQKRGDLTPERRRNLPVTSLKRLIDTPAVRTRLGLEVRGGVLHLLAEPRRVAKALMHVIDDLVSRRTKVTQIYTTDQRKAYAKKLPPDVAVTSTIPPGQGAPALEDGEPGPANMPPRATARQRRGGKRDRLITRDCVLKPSPRSNHSRKRQKPRSRGSAP